MLALLIPCRKSVTSKNIDVYLTPLIEELLELWKGIPAIDVSDEPPRQHFKLRALLLWCIHDFPAYGLTSGQITKGIKRVRSVAQMLQISHQRLSERMYI